MFITFNQNNSGGYFIKDDNVDKYVIIEGDSVEEILDRANYIFCNYRRYCSCCGERWDDDWKDESDLDDKPSIYGDSVYTYNDGYSSNSKCIIYYKNGTKETIDISRK